MSWKAAAVGVVSGAAGLAVALTITAISGSDANPLQAVAESVRDLVPGSIATELVELVGHADKPLLVAGVAIGGAAIAALAGVLAVRRRWAGVAVFLLMGAVALVAAASRPGGAEGPVLAVVIGTLTWLVVLDFLRPVPELPGRRAVVILGLVAGVSAVVAAGGSMIGRHRREVEAVREALSLPVGKGVVPVGADLCVDGLTPWRIPNADFYRIDTALTVPTIEPDEWRLRVHGMVERELTLTYDDLLARELTEAWVTLSCVSNTVGGSLIGNAYWSGVRVADLLAECGVHPDADAVRQTSYDGWTAGTPIEALTDGRDALLAVAMNGQPLPLEHGFPVRMVVPGLYGYVSATKWVTELEVTRFDRFDAYWTTRGWSERGPIKTESRIDCPGAARSTPVP